MIYRLFAMLAVMLTAFAPDAAANVVGGDLQNFNPTPSGLDFATVHSSETLNPGVFNLNLMMNHAVNSLPYYSDEGSTQNRLRYNDALTMADFGSGFGIVDNLEAGFSLQDLLKQSVSSDEGSHGEFSAKGIINYRFYGKYRLFGAADGGAAIVVSRVFNRVRNNPFIGLGGSNVNIVELAGDMTFGPVAAALNAGYRARKKGDQIPTSGISPVGDQIIASVGMSYLLPVVDTKLIAEIFGARPASKTASRETARQSSSAELLIGVKYDVTSEVAMQVGGGTELINGASSPDWRAYAGVNWSFEAVKQIKEELFKRVAPKEDRAVLHNIQFATGSDDVPESALANLQTLAAAINAEAYETIEVEGHTDSVGGDDLNQALSQRRAEAVRRWLIDNAKVDPAKITAVGYGETRPVADNGNFQGRQRNRRVEVAVHR